MSNFKISNRELTPSGFLKFICLPNGLFFQFFVFLQIVLFSEQGKTVENATASSKSDSSIAIPSSPVPYATHLPQLIPIPAHTPTPTPVFTPVPTDATHSTTLQPVDTPIFESAGLNSKKSFDVENRNLWDSKSIVWSAEGGFGIKVFLLPPASYTKNTFNGTYLNLSAHQQIKPINNAQSKTYSLVASMDFFDKTDNLSSHFYPTLRDIYWMTIDEEQGRVLRIGYFLSPMIEQERRFWKGYLLGRDRAGLWEHYAYLKTTEAGIDYGSVGQPVRWRIGFMNTDAEKADPMIQKDILASIELLPLDASSIFAGVCLQKGWYEGLPIKLNNKDRGFLWVGQQVADGVSWTIELFNALDAVDGIKKPIAESVDLLQRGGQLVHAHAVAILLGKNFENYGRKFRVDLRVDDLDPDLDRKFNSLQANTLIISVPQDIGQMSFSLENLYLQKEHSIGSKLRSTVRLDYIFQL